MLYSDKYPGGYIGSQRESEAGMIKRNKYALWILIGLTLLIAAYVMDVPMSDSTIDDQPRSISGAN